MNRIELTKVAGTATSSVVSTARLSALVSLAIGCFTGIALAAPQVRGGEAVVTDSQGSEQRARPEANPRSLEANEQGIAALKTGNTRTAEDRFRRALEVDAGNLTAAFNLSGALVVNGKKLEAISLLSDYAKRFPKDAGFAVRLGDVLFSSEKVKEALVHYERALSIDPHYPKLSEKLALGYALTQRIAESEKMYELAVAAEPNDGELLTNLAGVQLANNKAEAAVITARRAAQLAPSSRLYVTLGSALEGKGDLAEALLAFKKAKELGDNTAELGTKISRLEKR
jgi:tetratricopeptide (TPR) repeat protein